MAVQPASSSPFQAKLRVCRDTLFSKPWARAVAPNTYQTTTVKVQTACEERKEKSMPSGVIKGASVP